MYELLFTGSGNGLALTGDQAFALPKDQHNFDANEINDGLG